MRGTYHMRDWEIAKYNAIVSREIERIKVLPSHRRSFVEENVCPANIIQTLEVLGWDYDFQITLFYCGYTFDIELYRTED